MASNSFGQSSIKNESETHRGNSCPSCIHGTWNETLNKACDCRTAITHISPVTYFNTGQTNQKIRKTCECHEREVCHYPFWHNLDNNTFFFTICNICWKTLWLDWAWKPGPSASRHNQTVKPNVDLLPYTCAQLQIQMYSNK